MPVSCCSFQYLLLHAVKKMVPALMQTINLTLRIADFIKRNRMDLTQFDILYSQEKKVHVAPEKEVKDMLYVLHFTGRKPPLMLTRGRRAPGNPFWTR